MNRSGWNPSRRNRNIGTANRGFKSRNGFGIPDSWPSERIYWQKLKNPVIVHDAIGAHEFSLIVEPTYDDFRHHVSIADLTEILRHVPEAHRRDIKLFVWRQPSRKEAIFASVWGRLGYLADFGRYWGPTIILEAQPVDMNFTLNRGMADEMKSELERLRAEGHGIEMSKRHFVIQSPPVAIRNTQLYRTLMHEIGHYVDFIEKVESPIADSAPEADDAQSRYFARPSVEREHFAEKYAATLRAKLESKGVIPFSPLPLSEDQRSKINQDWFMFP
jgi:hypothetical protein